MQSKISQTGKRGGTVPEREPLENLSCLTHLCHLVDLKLACSASFFFFHFISLLVPFLLPAFLLPIVVLLISTQSE